MNIIYSSSTTTESFRDTLEAIYDKKKTIFILSCANDYTKDQLDPILQQYENNIFGAVFPEIIYKGEAKTKGVIFILFDELFKIIQINNLHDQKNIDTILEKVSLDKHQTCFVFADALSKKIDLLTKRLNIQFGSNLNYIGAGSGNLNVGVNNGYCIFTNEGFFKQCAVLAFGHIQSSVCINHGYKPISKPFIATNTKDNILFEIDHQNAYEVYKNTIIEHYPTLQNDFKFEHISKNFSLGIKKINSEQLIVRDPIILKDDALICIGNIEPNSTLYILYANQENIVDATKSTSIECLSDCDFDTDLTFYFAGVSRAYLGEETISKDLNSISENKEYITGALCLGEIAKHNNTLLNFHNKTTIIAKVQTNAQ